MPGLRGGPNTEAGRVSLLFDQNLSRRLPVLLAAQYPGSEQVVPVGLAAADDRAVWAYAAAHGLAVVSKAADFRQLAATLGPPPKVVWLRLGNGPTRDVEALLRSRVADVLAFLADPAAALLELR
jgi:predicted nuclease of predicted toxin-antitoxin system